MEKNEMNEHELKNVSGGNKAVAYFDGDGLPISLYMSEDIYYSVMDVYDAQKGLKFEQPHSIKPDQFLGVIDRLKSKGAEVVFKDITDPSGTVVSALGIHFRDAMRGSEFKRLPIGILKE